MFADLEKAKWTLTETPRYRQAGRSPVFISGKYLTSAGTCPATGERDGKVKTPARAKRSTEGQPAAAIDEREFYKALHAKGFAVKISQNILTGELETQIPTNIASLGLKFEAAPANTREIHVIQTTAEILLTMPLDKFLEVAGIRPTA